MASEAEIANFGLTLLGQNRVTSLNDNVKEAREMKAVYAMTRNALLANYDWTFARDRAALPALVDAPAFGFTKQYQMPTDCVRLVELNDIYVGLSLVDYRGASDVDFEIEGTKILTDLGAPLNIKYTKRVTDTGVFSDAFAVMLGAKLAYVTCEVLTGSNTKQDKVMQMFRQELSAAIRSNAISLPPQKLADDEWVLSRL